MKRILLFALVLPVLVMTSCEKDDTIEVSTDPQGVLINGVRWATTNVDAPETFAAKPEDFGLYYQWGKNVGWSVTGPLISTNGDTTLDKNIVSVEVWEPANDPCPDGWQVPSLDDFVALTDENKVVNTWTTLNGKNGRLFVDKATEKSIFLPAIGYEFWYSSSKSSSMENTVSTHGFYWSSTAHGDSFGYILMFSGTFVSPDGKTNYASEESIRCVRSE
jgi:uncharacterized protein (TIGR02145 family)